MKSLFFGEIRSDRILPYPEPPEEERATTEILLEQVGKFGRDRIDARKIDREHRIPPEVLQGLKELGVFGGLVPEAYGGLGLSQTSYCRLLSELAGFCGACAATVGAHSSIGMKGILLFGTEEQKKRFLPRLATGEWLAAYALTESGAGSDAASIACVADPTPDGKAFVLRGTKIWITNGGLAHLFTVFAKTPDPEAPADPAKRRITAFVVTRDLGGVVTGRDEDKMGLRGSSTTEVHFEGVEVPRANLLGEEGHGFRLALEILNSGRHGLAAGCAGAGRTAYRLALEHARTRRQFGRPIAEFDMVAEKLAGMAADLYAIDAAAYLAAGMMDRGEKDVALESACCKIFATESLWRIANDALQIAGGSGFMSEYPYERIVRDARVNLIFEGTNQILRVFLALQGLKAPGGYLQEVAEALRHPISGLGQLLDYSGRRLRRRIGRPRFSGAHESLREEASWAEEAAADLSLAAEGALRRHGRGIVEAEFEQGRLADMAIALYVLCAVIARATSTLPALPSNREASAPPGSSSDLARLATRRARRAFEAARRDLERNDDGLVRGVARALREDGGPHAGGEAG